MEDPSKTTDFVTSSVSMSSDIPDLRRIQSDPDVPDDIEDDPMLHFNDPNWDFRDNSSTLSISTDGVESQRWTTISGRTGTDTAKTESRVSTWHVHDPNPVACPILAIFCPHLVYPCRFRQGFTLP
jgi:hypothetical protein